MDNLKKLWEGNLNNNKLQVYIHNPFCISVCKFCAYKGVSYNIENYNFYYKEFLPNYIKNFNSIINKFDNVVYWFGGGTPNIMKDEDMENIFSLLNLDKTKNHKSIEVNPSLLTFKQIDIFKKYQFNTIAIGIQTFNEELLNSNNRLGISPNKLKSFVKYIHHYNMNVSVDLLVLENSKMSNFLNDLEIISNCNVEQIVTAYDYKFKKNYNVNKMFVHTVLDFLKINNNYLTEVEIEDLYEYMKCHASLRLRQKNLKQDVLKYISDIDYRKSIDNINVLSLGTWNNRKIFNKVGDMRYNTTIIDKKLISIDL